MGWGTQGGRFTGPCITPPAGAEPHPPLPSWSPPQVDRSLIKNVLAIYQEVRLCAGFAVAPTAAAPAAFSMGRNGLPRRSSTQGVQAAVSMTRMPPHCGAVGQVGMGQMDCYEHDFEEPMLKDTADYYRRKAAVWVQVRWRGGGCVVQWVVQPAAELVRAG